MRASLAFPSVVTLGPDLPGQRHVAQQRITAPFSNFSGGIMNLPFGRRKSLKPTEGLILMAPQKSLEQQLAETRARQERIKARLAQLEVRKKAKDQRKRAQGTMSLVKVIFDRIATQPAFKEELESLVAQADLKPHEREAALVLLSSFEEGRSSTQIELASGGGRIPGAIEGGSKGA
jgi:hypothetical protein